MTPIMVDEMVPAAAARILRDQYHRDAVHVGELGLTAAPDTEIAVAARAESRALVTENVADFAGERDLVLVFLLKRHLPGGAALAAALAAVIDEWLTNNPKPYVGPHWPKIG